MKEIIYLPTNKLHPNDLNPRKGVGDITELKNSIEALGVLQALTVTPAKGCFDGDYYIVIGERRWTACKELGIEELPCIIEELTEKQQLDIMLAENEQRGDLTHIERSNGYQLALDFHGDVGTVAENTGVSESTVRRYLKLQAIPEYARQAIAQREKAGTQISMTDFEKVLDIRDEDLRAEASEDLGTETFTRTLSNAQWSDKRKYEQACILEKLGLMKAIEITDTKGYSFVQSLYNLDMLTRYALDDEQYYYNYSNGNYYLYRKAEDNAEGEEEDEISTEEEERIDAICETFDSMVAEFRERREEFVKSLLITDEETKLIIWAMLAYLHNSNHRAITKNDYVEEYYLDTDTLAGLSEVETYEYIKDAIKNGYTYGLFLTVYKAIEVPTWCEDLHDFEAKYMGTSSRYEFLYKFLGEFGYVPTDEELAYMNGTHKLYEREEQE